MHNSRLRHSQTGGRRLAVLRLVTQPLHGGGPESASAPHNHITTTSPLTRPGNARPDGPIAGVTGYTPRRTLRAQLAPPRRHTKIREPRQPSDGRRQMRPQELTGNVATDGGRLQRCAANREHVDDVRELVAGGGRSPTLCWFWDCRQRESWARVTPTRRRLGGGSANTSPHMVREAVGQTLVAGGHSPERHYDCGPRQR